MSVLTVMLSFLLVYSSAHTKYEYSEDCPVTTQIGAFWFTDQIGLSLRKTNIDSSPLM